ncbi:anaerobic dimethyl sulfoxide reductase chain B [Campylobacter hyointestinalis]|uniref:4Fe-4S dicluster domain-containing protein n=1 Tax=Campylobacter hyointestinalis TaxID=198 RepID=UPI00072A5FEA|nr:4Fe-4S dicluster domain-containing protein [Campylobacter hyointestinalis]CUU88842.1 anaerobic dimethyl sulfoxide reductase chain B [Campylobacter hyointestinalis]
MKKFVMVHDENLCIGCQACSVACRNENNVPSGVFRLQVIANMSGVFPKLKTDFVRQSCVMCEDSPCVSVCPTGASFKTENGITLIDERLCVSCKYCILACPYDARFVDPITKAIGKCTFCYENRLMEGKKPACVTVCPTDALVFGDARDEESEVSKLIARKNVQYPKAHLNTKPSLGFIKNTKGGRYE